MAASESTGKTFALSARSVRPGASYLREPDEEDTMKQRSKVAIASLATVVGLVTIGAGVASAQPPDLGPQDIQPPNEVPPTVNVFDAQVVEGNAGTKYLQFQVKLTKSWDESISVSMKTVNLNLAMHPAGPADYTAKSVSLNFQPGVTQRSFSVSVKGDTVDEYDELFGAAITGASNAKIGDDDAVGKIIDDDMPIAQPQPEDEPEPDQPEPPAEQPDADDDQGNGGNGGGGNQGGGNGGSNGAGTGGGPDTTIGEQDPGLGEGEQALGGEDAVEVSEQSEAGIGLGTWLLALAIGLTLTALVILLVSRRRRQI
jgi:hypothetical protein